MGKRKGGRPTPYDPKFCEQLTEHMEKGFSFPSFGALAGVGTTTLYEWAKVHPEFAEAKEKAELKALFFWEKAGVEGLYTDKDTRFNPAVWIFTMKARFHKFGYRDNHDIDDASSEKLRQTSTERLLKIVQGARSSS